MSALDAAQGFLEFQSAAAIPGLRAFTSLRGYNLGLNTEEAAESVVAQRQALWTRAGLPLESSVFMQQVHGDHIATVTAADRGRGSLALNDAIPASDGLITAAPGSFLCVGHADCLAVLIADPVKRVVAAAHMGWRGAEQDIAGQVLSRMQRDFACRAADLWAGLSCCLGPCHLELSAEQYALFTKQDGHAAFCSPLIDGHFKLDLWAAAIESLTRGGLPLKAIETQRYCTLEETQALYSYRGEKGKTGRMMSVIGFV